MGVPVSHRDEVAHRRLIAGLLNLIDSQRPITYDPKDVSSGSPTVAEFENIPSWAGKITVALFGVSTNGSENLLVQFKVGGSWVTSGYNGSAGRITSTGTAVSGGSGGFFIWSNSGGHVHHGLMSLVKLKDHDWAEHYGVGRSDANAPSFGGGSISLSGPVEGVRVTMNTNSFDAGSIGCRVEK